MTVVAVSGHDRHAGLFEDQADHAAHVGHQQRAAWVARRGEDLLERDELGLVLVDDLAQPPGAVSQPRGQLGRGRRRDDPVAQHVRAQADGLEYRPASPHQTWIDAECTAEHTC